MIGMFKKKPILSYEPFLKHYQNSIVPSKSLIPEWYKKIPQWHDNEMFNKQRGFTPTVKQCLPFLDSLTLGYLITLPYDIFVKNDDGVPLITWTEGVKNPPRSRPITAHEKIVPAGHSSLEFTWNYCVSYVVPKGYSILFTHPINRHDLPFTTISGVIDGDMTMSAHGNVPFYIKQNFEGIIEQGTPIAQLIPFRQENWKSVKTKGLCEVGDMNNSASTALIRGWYKKTFWTRKKYD
jgi:hypothetical protein